MAQSVKRLALAFSSGHDLTVHEFEPCIRLCVDSEEPAWDSPSPSLSLHLPCLHSLVLSLSLSKRVNKLKKKLGFVVLFFFCMGWW